MRTITTTAFLAALISVGCGGSKDPAPAAPAAGDPSTPAAPAAEEHEHDFPPDVTAFHDVLSPVWHSEATPKPACPNSSQLYMAAENIDPMAAPEGVDPDAWQEAVDLLLASALMLSQACNQMGDEAAAQDTLVEMHDRFHALVALVGHQEQESAR
jgi:hypothetical protein